MSSASSSRRDQITVAVTNFCADILRFARAAGPHRPADGVGHRRSRRGRGAPLRQRRRPRDVGDFRRLRRTAWRGRARRGRLPAEPDPAGARRAVRRRSRPAARRRPPRSTATSTWPRSPSTGSDRRATSTTSSSSMSSAASGWAFCTTANCFAARTASAPTSATSCCARRATAADGSRTRRPRPR